ncbi:DNA-binding transcriptional repressor AcrR [compost metagenome]
MSTSEKKLIDNENVKSLILDTAFDLYVVNGPEKTSIRSIAKKIGYSPTTIYLYYRNKDAIFHEIQKVAIKRLYSQINSVETNADPFIKLENMVCVYIDFAIENPHLYEMMFVLGPLLDVPELDFDWGNFKETTDLFIDAIESCLNAKAIIHTDIQTLWLFFWSSLHGMLSLYLSKRLVKVYQCDQTELRQEIKPVLNHFIKILLPEQMSVSNKIYSLMRI